MWTLGDEIAREAQVKGVQLSYESAFGHPIEADSEALKAALAALGADPTEARDSVSVDPVAVSWGGRGFDLKISLPMNELSQADSRSEASGTDNSGARAGEAAKKWENKILVAKATLELVVEQKKRRIDLDLKRAKRDGASFVVTVREKLPLGYHEGRVRLMGRAHSVLIISAPARSFQRRKKKKPLGLFVPLYALHSRQSLGIGDVSDLQRLSSWSAGRGVDFIGTLPLLPIYTGKPLLEPSPYSPVSRLFWTELYVDPRLAPEWEKSRRAQTLLHSAEFSLALARLKTREQVDYRGVAALKRKLLEVLAEEFDSVASPARQREFKKYLAQNPLAEKFAEFCAAGDKFGKPWQEWPAKARDGELKTNDYRARDKRYHLYAQWLADSQLAAVAAAAKAQGTAAARAPSMAVPTARGIAAQKAEKKEIASAKTRLAARTQDHAARSAGLYLDFPLSVHASGFDVWWFRNDFARGATAGSPPDPTYIHGQDWGILPLHPVRMRQSGYEYVRRALAHHMRYATYLRLDHVMGFYRLFWVLPKLGAKRGVYVRYPMEELFAILCLESHRNQCELIGEDLGTVPVEIRDAMTRHGILRMGIQQFEINPGSATPFSGVPSNAMVSLNTHDLPLFAAFWNGDDLRDQNALGYFGAADLKKRLGDREKAKARLVRLLKKENLLPARTRVAPEAVLRALLYGSARSNVAVMQLTLEDLWLETRPQNTPGTSFERPNWVRKTKLTLEELMASETVNTTLRDCARLRP